MYVSSTPASPRSRNPDMVEDLGSGEHPAGVGEEVAEQPELGAGQLDRSAGAPYLVALLVQLEVGDGEPRGRRGRTALVAAEHGPDAGHQLLDAEGLVT